MDDESIEKAVEEVDRLEDEAAGKRERKILICPKCKQVVTKIRGAKMPRFYCDCGYSGAFVSVNEKDLKGKQGL